MVRFWSPELSTRAKRFPISRKSATVPLAHVECSQGSSVCPGQFARVRLYCCPAEQFCRPPPSHFARVGRMGCVPICSYMFLLFFCARVQSLWLPLGPFPTNFPTFFRLKNPSVFQLIFRRHFYRFGSPKTSIIEVSLTRDAQSQKHTFSIFDTILDTCWPPK